MCGAAGSFEEAGASLAVIGSGKPWHAQAFIENQKVPETLRLLVDPDLKTFHAAQLHRSVARTFSLLSTAGAIKALTKGHMQGATKGDPFQQGGVVAIATSGQTLFHHVNERAGDHGDLKGVLEAVRAAA